MKSERPKFPPGILTVGMITRIQEKQKAWDREYGEESRCPNCGEITDKDELEACGGLCQCCAGLKY